MNTTIDHAKNRQKIVKFCMLDGIRVYKKHMFIWPSPLLGLFVVMCSLVENIESKENSSSSSSYEDWQAKNYGQTTIKCRMRLLFYFLIRFSLLWAISNFNTLLFCVCCVSLLCWCARVIFSTIFSYRRKRIWMCILYICVSSFVPFFVLFFNSIFDVLTLMKSL